MSIVVNNSIFSTFCLEIGSLVLFKANFASHLKVIWHYYSDAILMPKRHDKDIITTVENILLKFIM